MSCAAFSKGVAHELGEQFHRAARTRDAGCRGGSRTVGGHSGECVRATAAATTPRLPPRAAWTAPSAPSGLLPWLSTASAAVPSWRQLLTLRRKVFRLTNTTSGRLPGNRRPKSRPLVRVGISFAWAPTDRLVAEPEYSRAHSNSRIRPVASGEWSTPLPSARVAHQPPTGRLSTHVKPPSFGCSNRAALTRQWPAGSGCPTALCAG